MARGYSRVIIVGNLGRDPEMRYLPSGDPVVNFTVAVNRRRREGENWVDETDWFRVACFRRLAEIADQYLRKGSQVLIDGQLSIRQYTTQDGTERTSVEISCDQLTMLGDRAEEGGDRAAQPARQQRPSKPVDDFDDFDDVPF